MVPQGLCDFFSKETYQFLKNDYKVWEHPNEREGNEWLWATKAVSTLQVKGNERVIARQ